MNPDRLQSDELTHELIVRNLPCFGTVAEKRKLLREAIQSEKRGVQLNITVQLDPNMEIEVCQAKLRTLNEAIDNINLNNIENDFDKIHSRLLHLSARIKRIPAEEAEEELFGEKNNCLIIVATLICNLKHIYSKSKTTLVDVNPGSSSCNVNHSLLDISLENFEETLNTTRGNFQLDQSCLETQAFPVNSTKTNKTAVNFSLPAVPIQNHTMNASVLPITSNTWKNSSPVGLSHHNNTFSLNETRSYDKPLSNWNITFDGNNLSVGQFIERINEISSARNVSKERLFQSAIELFTGDALIWFRSIRPTIASWDQLIDRLRSDFLPSDYENDLWDEIRARKQGQNEKVIIFIAVMENLFSRLTHHPTEFTRLEQIRRNLLPYFQSQLSLRFIRRISDLRELCKQLEDTKYQIERFQSPISHNSRRSLEPDLSTKTSTFRRVNEVFHEQNFEQNLSDLTYLNPLPSTSANSSNNYPEGVNNNISVDALDVTCWNCKARGHSWRSCKAKLNRFCYSCGNPNVTVRNCMRCAKNERTGPV